jgi:hypothetical protein
MTLFYHVLQGIIDIFNSLVKAITRLPWLLATSTGKLLQVAINTASHPNIFFNRLYKEGQ